MSDEKKFTNHPQDKEPMSFTKGLKAMISKKAGYKSARRANKVGMVPIFGPGGMEVLVLPNAQGGEATAEPP